MKEDRIKFMIIFTRFEYAMKQSDILIAGDNGAAKADWGRIKNMARDQDYYRNNNSFAQSSDRILAEPPKLQVCDDGRLRFEVRGLGGGGVEAETIEAVKRIRNNLFHGAKQNEAREAEIRSDMLLNESMIILRECLKLSEEFRKYFFEGFDHEDIFYES